MFIVCIVINLIFKLYWILFFLIYWLVYTYMRMWEIQRTFKIEILDSLSKTVTIRTFPLIVTHIVSQSYIINININIYFLSTFVIYKNTFIYMVMYYNYLYLSLAILCK